MKRASDETLMAYADGVLTGEERREVEQQLMGDASGRRTVRLYRKISLLVQEAFWNRDFSAGQDRLERLIADGGNRGARKSHNGKHRGIMSFAGSTLLLAGMAAAAAALAIVVMPQDGIESDAATLRGAVAAFERSQHRAGSAPAFTAVAHLRDKFGNPCREVEWHPSGFGTLADAVLVVCRSPGQPWAIVGAVATRSQSAVEPYVSDIGPAREALNGVLEMIGAERRASAFDREG
ncbi:MAG: anti-sigma factor family protein [Hyphomicrobiaceae bacterium]